jgi:hypothetical protein
MDPGLAAHHYVLRCIRDDKGGGHKPDSCGGAQGYQILFPFVLRDSRRCAPGFLRTNGTHVQMRLPWAARLSP